MRSARVWIAVAGVLVLVFGLLCLNYTKADGLEHHQAAALRYGLPPPGRPILYGGVAAVVIGAGLVGYAVGLGRRPRA
jgi:hypothetical protein